MTNSVRPLLTVGRALIFEESAPARTAQPHKNIPLAAPSLTKAAGAPTSLAICAPAFWCRSFSCTNDCDARTIAATTGSGILEPPSVVMWP
jgi:hypothetical protein